MSPHKTLKSKKRPRPLTSDAISKHKRTTARSKPAPRNNNNNNKPSSRTAVAALCGALPFELQVDDTIKQGRFALEWLLAPLQTADFFKQVFEKLPKLVRADQADRFASLISLDDIHSALHATPSQPPQQQQKQQQQKQQQRPLHYGTDIDVTRFSVTEGRTTHNGAPGRQAGKEAWQAFLSGASLRLRRPQLLSDAIFRLCAHLEAFVECVVGANVYLTPADSQGFAPHFDDVDAFVCQVAGRKRWLVYAPREDGLDRLPRRSSVDFSRDDVGKQDVALDVELAPGDMLYLPRGAIHEARCPAPAASSSSTTAAPDYSLHVTVSMFQRWTWADLLLESAESAIASAAAESLSLRRTLPLRFARYSGASPASTSSVPTAAENREKLHSLIANKLRDVAKQFPTDAAADMLAARFMRERLPPVRASRGRLSPTLALSSRVRSVAGGIARIVLDIGGDTDGLPRLVHCAANDKGRVPLNEDVSMNCLPAEAAAVDFILKAYPHAVVVGDLPLNAASDKIDLVEGLIDMGLVEEH